MNTRHLFRTVALLLSAATAFSPSPARGQAPLSKVDLQVLKETRNGASTSYWAILRDQADLGAAESMSWIDRGRFVFHELTTTAQSSQAGILSLLDSFPVERQSFWIVNMVRVISGRGQLEALSALPDVARVVPDGGFGILPLPGQTEPAVGTVEWNIARIRASDVWDTGTTGQGIVVGNIDTGVDYTHSALVNQYRGNLGGGAFDHNYNWWDPSHICGPAGSPPCDNNFHGTHTMGTIVGGDGPGPFANDIGVAPGARWIAAKGCESGFCSLAALVSSGQWMVAPTDLQGNNPDPDRRPHIVSNSWGGSSGNSFYQDIVRAWRAAGIFPVFASGNSGDQCGTVVSPGDYPESFAVGATDLEDVIATFSSRGPSSFGPIKPEASAPGVNVRSSVPGNGYLALSGTSMATPHVAGLVALIWSAKASLRGDIAGTTNLIKNTSVNRLDFTCGGGSSGDPNNVYGDGRIDALAAVGQSSPRFRRGFDCVPDGSTPRFDITDAIGLVTYAFRGGTAPSCKDACDVNDDGRLDIADVISMINFLFRGGLAPSAPFQACGNDPTPDALNCPSAGACP